MNGSEDMLTWSEALNYLRRHLPSFPVKSEVTLETMKMVKKGLIEPDTGVKLLDAAMDAIWGSPD